MTIFLINKEMHLLVIERTHLLSVNTFSKIIKNLVHKEIASPTVEAITVYCVLNIFTISFLSQTINHLHHNV